MNKLRHELWTFCKAQLTAQVATFADFCMSLFLAELVGAYYVTASFLGALTGGLINCSMNYKWVFRPEGMKKKHVLVKYFMVWGGSIALNTMGTYALTELSGQYFIFAKAVVAVIVALFWNYQMQRFFVYRETHVIGKIKKIKEIKNKTTL